MIKRAAAAGAVAWTAPLIVDSFASPAAAVTSSIPVGCYKIHVDHNNCIDNWDNSCAAVCDGCCGPALQGQSSACPAGLIRTNSLQKFCISTTVSSDGITFTPVAECSIDILRLPDYVRFTIDPGCFPRFTAGFAKATGGGGGDGPCQPPIVGFTSLSYTFQKTATSWNEFHLCVSPL